MTRLRSAWPDVLALASLAAVTLLLLSAILLTNRVLAGVDALTYFTPYRDYANAVLRRGQLPLWNPYLFMGVPFLANSQSAVLYPLNWLFTALWAPKALAWSAALHIWLAAAFTYGYGRRRLSLSRVPAWIAAAVYAFGGFLAGQVEHVNQLSSGAWFPLLLWLLEESAEVSEPSAGPRPALRSWTAMLALSAVVALQILAGHVQSAYISAAGMAIVALWPVVDGPMVRRRWSDRVLLRGAMGDLARRLVALVLPLVLGAALAAVQLLPTLELSGMSIRAGGLPYRDAAAFSLRPRMLLYTLMPVYGEDLGNAFGTEGFTEYIAYGGLVALGCALLAIWKGRHQAIHRPLIALALVGLALAMGAYNPLYYALYRILPGFDLFRVPARWMLLYSFGVAALAGLGSEHLLAVAKTPLRLGVLQLKRRHLLRALALAAAALVIVIWLRKPGWLTWVMWACTATLVGGLLVLARRSELFLRTLPGHLALLVAIELVVASRALPHASPTAPEAISSLRTAPAELISDPGLHRFLSMSDITFDPGDLGDTQSLFADSLAGGAVYDLVVASKQQEILAPNLPLLHRVQAVDGYDGGILPLARYTVLQRLFLDESAISPDGRLREQLNSVPAGRLLSLLNVKYVITDKLLDVWAEDVYYDLQHRAVLGPGGVRELVLSELPASSITAIGVVSHLDGAATLADREVVAELTLFDQQGTSERLVIESGSDTAEGLPTGRKDHGQASVVFRSSDDPPVQEYLSLLELRNPQRPDRLVIRATRGDVDLVVRGISLVDQRTGAHWPLTVSSDGHFVRVHSGDVKIYENLDVLPRAYLVHSAVFASEDEEALRIMADSGFDPATGVALQDVPLGTIVSGSPETVPVSETVAVVSYEPERVAVEARLDSPGYVVLSDTYYPGWKVQLDGESAAIIRANLNFRAVAVPVGEHSLVFTYEPVSLARGARLSAVAGLAWLAGLCCAGLRVGRRRTGRFGRGTV